MEKRYIIGAAIAVIAVLAAAAFIVNPFTTFSAPEPSSEGLHLILVGVQPAGSNNVYVVNSDPTSICQSVPCPYVVSVPDTGQFYSAGLFGPAYTYAPYDQTNAVLQRTESTASLLSSCIGCSSTLKITPSAIAPLVNPLTGNTSFTSIRYTVPVGGSTTSGFAAQGYIQEVPMQIGLSIESSSSSQVQFKNDILWFAAFSEEYNNAIPTYNPTGPNGELLTTWASPLLVQFNSATVTTSCAGSTNGQIPNCAQNYGTSPGYQDQGYSLTLYNAPQSTSGFQTLISDPSGIYSVPQKLASSNILAPSTQMLEYGFFGVDLTNLGPYACGILNLDTCDNSVLINLTAYVLVMGTSLWNSPITTSQTQHSNNCNGPTCGITGWLNGLGAWLGSPAGILTLIMGIVVLAVIAIVVLKLLEKI